MTRAGRRSVAPLVFLLGCSRGAPSVQGNVPPPSSAAPARAGGAATAEDASATVFDVGGVDASAGASVEAPDEPAATYETVSRILFADRGAPSSVAACPPSLPPDARVRCLYDERYRGDPRAASLAHELYVKWNIVAGVELAHTMNGGYRGMIRIEPAVPTGENRKHLEWVAAAFADFEQFFAELQRFGAAHGKPKATRKRFRYRPLTLRFMRSAAPARTPAAYARDWTVAYNFVGTLNVSADAVRETMFHEIFHLNDEARGDWSPGALSDVFDAVVKKCGTSIACLAPYSPNDTIVRGGTYYSFQPGNGVREYAAELALRYYREQRAALRDSSPKPKPFKCGPAGNARAWARMRDDLFDGIDAVPACP